MDGLGLLATVSGDNMVTGFKVFLVGFLGVVFCMCALTLVLKIAMVLITRFENSRTSSNGKPAAAGAAAGAAPAAPKSDTKKDA